MPPVKDPVTGKFVSSTTVQTEPNEPPPAPAAPAPDAGTTGKPDGNKKETNMAGAKALMESWLGDKPTVVPEKKEAKKDDGTPPEGTPPAKPAPKQPKPAAKPAPAITTSAEIASAVAEGVARALPKQPEAKKPDPTKEPEQSWLSDSDRRKLPILKKLEEKYPERYKGLAENFTTGKKALVDYAAKWQEEHPGETFDQTAEEHEAFFAEHNVDWDDDDYLDAATDLKVQEKLQETEKKTNAKLTEIERKEKLRELAPKITQRQNKFAADYWKQAGDEYSDLIAENGQVNEEKVKSLLETDPVGTKVFVHFADRLDKDIAELTKLMGIPGETDPLIDYDPENKIHVELANFAIAQEDRILAMPAEDRVNQKGQTFMVNAEYHKLPKAEREKYWTFSANDLATLRTVDLHFQAKKILDERMKELELLAKARGVTLPAKAQKSDDGKVEEPQPPLESDDGKPSSPTAGGGSKMAASKGKGSAELESGPAAFVLRSF